MEKYKRNLLIAAGFWIGIGLIFFFGKEASAEKIKKEIKKEADEIWKEADELEKKILQEQRSAAIQNFIE